MKNVTDAQANGGDGQVTALLSALTQASSVIVLGYVCALSGFVSPDAARGIGQLVGKIALPCLLFRAVATIDLATVNLLVVLVVILSKYLCLTVAALVGYFKNREQKENLTIAGTFALFCDKQQRSRHRGSFSECSLSYLPKRWMHPKWA
jgi:hypothetical protein